MLISFYLFNVARRISGTNLTQIPTNAFGNMANLKNM